MSAGRDRPDEIIDATPAVGGSPPAYIGDPPSPTCRANTSPRCPGAPAGARSRDQRCRFRRRAGPRVAARYDLWVGGGLSTNPMFAKRLGTFIHPTGSPRCGPGWPPIPRLWLPPLRNRARLKFLSPNGAPKKFREVLEKNTWATQLEDGPPPPPPSRARGRDHVGVLRRSGRQEVTWGSRLVSGGFRAPLRRVADLAARYGGGRIRTRPLSRSSSSSTWAADNVAPLIGRARRGRTCPLAPSGFRKRMMACTGIEFCKLAIVETKARAPAGSYARARGTHAGLHRGPPHQRERLPELVCPVPDRRYRADGRSLSSPPRRAPSPRDSR